MIIALIIVGVLVVIAFFSGMADEFWNIVNTAAVLAASLVLLIAPLFLKEEILAIFSKAVAAGEGKVALYSFLCSLIFLAVGFALGSPLIWAWKEKEYYLIFGTLASKTDYSAGLGFSILFGIAYALPGGLCFKAAAEKSSFGLFMVGCVIAVALSALMFTIMVIKYKRNN